MPQPTAEKKINHEPLSMTTLFWSAIIIAILIISLFAGMIAEGWLTQKTSEPQDKTTAQSVPDDRPVSKTAWVWKTLAQRVQQTEIKTLQVVTHALEKLPHLAPLPRPNVAATTAPANVEITPSPPIAWKLLGEQLAVTEQQEVMLLQRFLTQLEK
jgi:hypothetical protein